MMPEEQSVYTNGPWPMWLEKFSFPEDDSVHLRMGRHTDSLLSVFSLSDPKGSPGASGPPPPPRKGEGKGSLPSSWPPLSKHQQSCTQFVKGSHDF